MMRNFQLAATQSLERRHFTTHGEGTTEHIRALCAGAARPGDGASHPNILGGSSHSVPRVAAVPCTRNVHSQGTNFYGASDGCTSPRYTHAIVCLSCPNVACLQTCEYGGHLQPCHRPAWPALATNFRRIPKGTTPGPTLNPHPCGKVWSGSNPL